MHVRHVSRCMQVRCQSESDRCLCMEAAWSCWECLERFDPCRSITICSSCIWDKFVFLATGRPGDCMEMLLECLRNPGRRLGIVTGLQLVCGRWSTSIEEFVT
eukprot:Gb_41346 [translate_table: standard]